MAKGQLAFVAGLVSLVLGSAPTFAQGDSDRGVGGGLFLTAPLGGGGGGATIRPWLQGESGSGAASSSPGFGGSDSSSGSGSLNLGGANSGAGPGLGGGDLKGRKK